MQKIDATTWLVVQSMHGTPLSIMELPPSADPRAVMIRAMARSLDEGWEVEQLPGSIPLYFCRKDGERRQVAIVRQDPAMPAVLHRSHGDPAK